MPEEEIGFGIIGCGMIASWHAKALSQVPGVRLIGVTDPNREACVAFGQAYGARAFTTAEELLACPAVHAVCICTPSGLHAPLAVRAAQAGKHVVVEKPMALDVRQADQVIRACEDNAVKLEVISQMRFTQATQEIKRAVDSCALGRLVSGDIYMKYYRSPGYYSGSSWRGTVAMDGGGALMNQGIHGVDLLRYIMGPVRTVFAHTKTLVHAIEVEDTVSALLEYENGALGIIQATTSVFPGWPRRMEINGDRGSIALEEDCITHWCVRGEEPPEGIIRSHTRNGSASDPFDFGIDGHVRQLQDMADAIRLNRRPLVDAYEGRKPIRIIRAVYESAISGRMVYLDGDG